MSAITDAPPSLAIEGSSVAPEPARRSGEAGNGSLPHSPSLALLRLAVLLLWTLPLGCVQACLLACHANRASRRLALIYWRGVAAIIGLKVTVRGAAGGDPPVLYIVNHISYLDIVVLGSRIDAAFVAKGEIASWPGVGLIAKLGRTVFVERARRHGTARQKNEMRARLERDRDALILFPEGTSHDGSRVWPFKTSLFAAAAGEGGVPIAVQPVTIAYTALDGMPLGRGWRSLIAWYGEMKLLRHGWRLLGLGRVTAEIEFHPPRHLRDAAERKTVAAECQAVIAAGLARANGGRQP